MKRAVGRARGVVALVACVVSATACLTACGGDEGIPLDRDVVMTAPVDASGGAAADLDGWEPSDNPDEVLAVFYSGACDRLVSAWAEETAEAARLWVTIEVSDDMCTSDLVRYRVAVPLDKPLGDREVVDGGAGGPLQRAS
jgi:hypothetical protein